ncbi:MAG: YggS family pyridoxal phosphate-dependent enzyme [Bacteroidota bacterium]
MISERIDAIRQRIDFACRRAGRSAADVTLIAVTKTLPAEAVRETVAAGTADVGENYVQELLAKRRQLEDVAIRWHFVGHLQSNKVRQIAEWIHLIHAVDSAGLFREIDRRAERAGRVIDCLIEVNTTGEGSKFGVRPDDVTMLVREAASCSHVRIAGLMTIGPFLPNPEGSRPMFRRLRELRDEIRAMGQSNVTMQHLSMGMTGDFEVAIEEGATLLRIGTAIFGPRIKA